jgi:hypothetical protein
VEYTPTGLTVGRGEVHPNWSDGQQGRSQLSTSLLQVMLILELSATNKAKKQREKTKKKTKKKKSNTEI